MTAEVAILNKLAVALAADSAVTTGFPGRERIFTGANKIFTMSKHAPVGCMIYGHVEHCSIPWEVLLKEFRRDLATKRFPRVQEYLDEFCKFISHQRFVTEKSQETTVFGAAVSAYTTLRQSIRDSNKKANRAGIDEAFDTMEAFLETFDDLQALDIFSATKFSREYSPIFEALFDSNEEFHIEMPRQNRARFKQIVRLSLMKAMPSRFSSGLVVAGFGEDEMFPTISDIQIDGAIFNKCRIIGGDMVDIDRNGETVYMRAFAQEDVVKSFLNGVDEDYQNYVVTMMEAFMQEFLNEVLDKHTSYDTGSKAAVLTMTKESLKNSLEDFKSSLLEFCEQNYMTPVQDVLRSAPKDELANVAEALVSLTTLKRKVSGDKENVGGPVDVALISKGDGFIWIKRKHYFSPELNHHFTRNYFRDGGWHDEREAPAVAVGNHHVQAPYVGAPEPPTTLKGGN